MLKNRRNAQKILRHTDVYYCVVVGRLDLDLNPLHLIQENPLLMHAQLFAHYPHYAATSSCLALLQRSRACAAHNNLVLATRVLKYPVINPVFHAGSSCFP